MPILGNIKKRIKETTDKDEINLLNEYLEINQQLKEAKKENKELLKNASNMINSKIDDEPKNEDFTDLKIIKMYQELNDEINNLKKEIKEAETDLDRKAYNRYPTLTEDAIKTLVVDDKWLAVLEARTRGEMDRITQTLTRRVKELAERYGTPMPEIEIEVSELEERVNSHLERMGFSWE